MRPTREVLRLARRLHAIYEQRQIHARAKRNADWQRLEACFDEIHRRRGWMETAQLRGWQLAARYQERVIQAALRSGSELAQAIAERWEQPALASPTLHDLQAELQSLHGEFDRVVLEPVKKTLTVQTASIELQQTQLGPFLIRLHWPRLADHSGIDCFEVVALEPHSAFNDDDVVHPHVRNHRLCPGEGALPLQRATEQGRLVDAFQLIHSVLQTYNADSAYAPLDDWEGVSCWCCGAGARGDDAWFCDHCDHDLCNDCVSFCRHCDRYRCTSCQTDCDVCREPCCPRCLKQSAYSALACCARCLKVCAACGHRVASSEIVEATERCPTCLESPRDKEAVPSASDAIATLSSP